MIPKYQVCIKLKHPVGGEGEIEISFAQSTQPDDSKMTMLNKWCSSYGFSLTHPPLASGKIDSRRALISYNMYLYGEKKVAEEIVSLLENEGLETFVFVKEARRGLVEIATLEELEESE